MNRRLLLLGLAAVLVLLGVGVLALWPRRPAITRANAEKIQMGMTLAEVEELLGGPARNESNMPDNFINDAFEFHDCARPFEDKRWASPAYVVIVEFDDSGRVTGHFIFDFHGESLLDRLRRWLRL
jgi:hypothetical protein